MCLQKNLCEINNSELDIYQNYAIIEFQLTLRKSHATSGISKGKNL